MSAGSEPRINNNLQFVRVSLDSRFTQFCQVNISNILDKTCALPVSSFILLDRLIPQTAKTGNSFCLVPIDKLLHDNHRYFIFQIETHVYIMASRIGWHNPFVQLGSCYVFNVLAFCPGWQNIWHNKRFVH